MRGPIVATQSPEGVMWPHRPVIMHLFRLGVVVFGGVFIAIACHDDPTAPAAPHSASALAIAGDSSAPDLVFLPPLGPRRRPRGELDTTVAPAVVICRLQGDHCGADTVARFAPPLRDSAGAIVSGDTLGDTPGDRVTLAERAYLARWNLSAITPDTAVGYRIVVALGDTTVGALDVRIVPDGYMPSPSDTARFAFVTMRRTLRVRFQIFLPPDSLTVVLGPGVLGTPGQGAQTYRHGSGVQYRFDADTGFTNVLVTVDGELVPAHGRVVMDRAHVILASADRAATVAAGDEWIARRALALLGASDPVQAAQALLDDLDSMSDTVNIESRLERVERAVMMQADTSAVRVLDAALTGRTLRAGDGYGSIDEGESPPTGGGGGTATALLVPRATIAGTTATPSASIGPVFGTAEPVTIGFVNGVLTTPFGALFASNHVARLARAAHWNANVPFDVKLIYNRTAMRFESGDIRDRCVMRVGTLRGLGWLSLPVRLAQCTGERVHHYPQMLTDFIEAAAQTAAIMSRPSLAQMADADSVAAAVTRWRQAGRHVVLLPHSQGNLMVQQGIAALRDRGAYRPAADTTCIGVVSLAAPTSHGWPVSAAHLSGLVVEGDAILGIGLNEFPRVRTSLTDSADHDGNAMLQRIAPDVARVVQIGWAMRLHELIASYLKAEPMHSRVQDALVHTYRSCALGAVDVLPQQLALRTGESGSFSVTLSDMNGTPLDGVRGMSWTASQFTDWQRAVQLAADGTVHARYVGGTSVQAVTRSRTGTGGVEVGPAPLAVSTSEQFSAEWVLVYGGMLRFDQPQGVVPPPPATGWDGGSCTEKTEFTYTNWSGVYSKRCTAAYDVTSVPFPAATRYNATFFQRNATSPVFTISRPAPPLHGEISGPAATLDMLPGPALVDRIFVTAWDAAGHLLANGQACAHGCVGWP